MFKRKTDYLIAAILPVLLLAIWQVSVSWGWVPNTLIASPLQTIISLWNLTFTGQIFIHVAVSFYRLLVGFLVGAGLGIALGTVVGVSRFADKLVSPLFQMIAPIPPIAWIPLLIIIFGIGELSKIALLVIATFIVLFLNTVQGIRSADEKLVDVARVYKKSDMQLAKDVLLPSALPLIFTGLRVALGLSWILLIAAEVIASSKGLGWLIWDSRNFSRPDDMFAGMIVIGLLGKLSDMLLVTAEKHTTSWRRTFAGK